MRQVIKGNAILVFSTVCTIILITLFSWFIAGESPLETESPFRIVLGSLLIFILPGLIWGEILGLRSNHFLETIALSFALTLTIEVLILPIPFLFASTIRLWVILLLVVCTVGMIMLLFRRRATKEMEFINPLFNFFKQPFPLNISTLLIVTILAIVSIGTYRWGEDVFGIAGEKILHMIFVRFYYSLPMTIHGLGIWPGTPPPNVVDFWEYLIAGWASLINMDPLLVFYRARFTIPILGLSGMYFLIKNIFPNRLKAEIIFWGVLMMCLGWFFLLSPSPLDWIKNSDDLHRGSLAFMETAHRGDAAMGILIPLITGLILLALHNPSWRSTLLLTGTLTATFMWHPREFFQTGVYAGVLGIAILLASDTDRKSILKKWARIMAVFIIVAIFFFSVSHTVILEHSHGHDEFRIKEAALRYAFLPENLTGIRHLFNFPQHLGLPSSTNLTPIQEANQLSGNFTKDWNFFLWLILSAIAIPILAVLGDKEDRKLSLFFTLLWFLVLGWNFSMLIFTALTYSEIYMTTPRMIYTFSYVIIPAAIYRLSQLLNQKRFSHKGRFIFLFLMCSTGLTFHWWWQNGTPCVKPMSMILSIIVLISFLLSLFPKLTRTRSLESPAFSVTVLGLFLFFLPILGKEYIRVIPKIIKESRQPIDWFGDNNPFNISKELIQYVKSLPPKQMFLFDMVYSKTIISIYAPQHLVATLYGVPSDVICAEFSNGLHPLFNPKTFKVDMGPGTSSPEYESQIVKHKDVKEWLNRFSVDYILVQAERYPSLLPYLQEHPEDYGIVFNNPKKGEIIVHCQGRSQNRAAQNE